MILHIYVLRSRMVFRVSNEDNAPLIIPLWLNRLVWTKSKLLKQTFGPYKLFSGFAQRHVISFRCGSWFSPLLSDTPTACSLTENHSHTMSRTPIRTIISARRISKLHRFNSRSSSTIIVKQTQIKCLPQITQNSVQLWTIVNCRIMAPPISMSTLAMHVARSIHDSTVHLYHFYKR